MKKTIITLIALLFLVSFASAYDYSYREYWDGNDATVIETHIYELHEDSNNHYRYGIEDYRNGWSYRSREVIHYNSGRDDYWKCIGNCDDFKPKVSTSHTSYRKDRWKDRWKDRTRHEEPLYYKEYNKYSGDWNNYRCYVNPPKDKLFYIKCPSY
jgi:hypothetical protein